MSAGDEEDPIAESARLLAEDRAWQEAQRRRTAGRKAIFDDLEEYSATPEAKAIAAAEPEGSERIEDDALKHDVVMMPRLFGKVLRSVPVSMPENAPITCLGKNGRSFFYLSPKGELVELEDNEHGQAHIAGLWAPEKNALERAFPQLDQNHRFTGFRANYARDAMMTACAAKPTFQAHDKVRGLGCWQGADGALVQHLGDRVVVGAEAHRLGEIDGYVYPGRPALAIGDGEDGLKRMAATYKLLQGWYWKRGELDARLLLGQLGASVLGAALEWRPMSFLCGDASTGKSTLQRLMRRLLPGRLKGTADASEASLRAMLGEDAVCVSFDEIEADAANDKAQQVMSLARKAASGDDVYRSGSDQKLRHFTLRGSFIFSAVVPPSMRDTDMQRFAFLLLQTLPKDAKLMLPTMTEEKAMGAAMVARITAAWPRWEGLLDAFALGLAREGHAQRSALQFGTLLAAAHVLLNDGEPTPAEIAHWCGQLKRESLFEYENSIPTWLRALRIVLNAQPEAWRTEGSPTVAQMVRRYLSADAAGEKDIRDKSHEKLTAVGLAICGERGTNRKYLAIPPDHAGVAAMFRGSDFQRAGGGRGAWHIPMTAAPEVAGDPAEKRGVRRSEKVPRLNRERCNLFWLDGAPEINGVATPIFDRHLENDLVDELVLREPGEEG